MATKVSRRKFLKDTSLLTTGAVLAGGSTLSSCSSGIQQAAGQGTIAIDPTPRFEISPHMYMQFMEPLGITDASVNAAWDYNQDDWRKDLITTVKDLAPDVIRWGGGFVRYYKWREGVGPPKKRPPMYNYYWGGTETNRVGTYELHDFCRRVGAEPLIAINFMSDGVQSFKNTVHGENRWGDVKEAADWVSYANDPDNKERIGHGHRSPFNIKFWQLGNETSYLYDDGFTLDEAVAHAITFSQAMKERDPSICIIGWGDVRNPEKLKPDTPKDDPDIQFWAGKMLQEAGEHLDMISMHMMGIYPRDDQTILGFEYQKDPEAAWEKLKELSNICEFRIQAYREELQAVNSEMGIAITEGHLSLQPYNANQILIEWLSAVYHARTLNAYLRHGDIIRICTGADFCGNRWTVNSVMMPVPRGESYLLPIGTLMRLFNRHKGTHGISITSTPDGLDIAASRQDNRLCLQVLNTHFSQDVKADFAIAGFTASEGKVYEIAPEDPRAYVDSTRPHAFDPEEKTLPKGANPSWTFPARSVSVVEIVMAEKESE
jgi:alpha-L-arabinofuranosidase